MNWWYWSNVLSVLIGLAIELGACGVSLGQPTILLRDFSIPASPVAGYDEDGVRLQNGDVVTWDRVAKAVVVASDQDRVDQWLHSIEKPLARLRWRLQIGDFAGAQQAAAELPTQLNNRRSQTALLM